MTTDDEPLSYRPGACNIGPMEIARRRRFGHLGLIATILGWLGLNAMDSPRPAMLLVGFPAAGAAVGYLQAHLRFCAAFGSIGVYNLGGSEDARAVTDDAARALDRHRAAQIGFASLGIGAVVGLAALLLRR